MAITNPQTILLAVSNHAGASRPPPARDVTEQPFTCAKNAQLASQR
jgi:hypothetical protein